MRISDWSSDVCSSDLAELGLFMFVLAILRAIWRLIVPGPINDADRLGWQTLAAYVTHILFYICFFALPLSGWAMWSTVKGEELKVAGIIPWPYMRSEEHTSELQSLMRISYAVFCLQKK